MEGREDFLMAAQMLGEGQRPGVLVFDGQTVACARGGEEWELERSRGGFDNQSEARVRVRKALLRSRPQKRDQVTLDGRAFTVDDVAGRAGDVAWSMTLLKDGADV